jgi:hypothetical protein
VRLCTVPLLRNVNCRARAMQPSAISQPNVVLRETPEPV